MSKINIKYILVDKEPVACEDFIEWAKWFERHEKERIVKQTIKYGVMVSTIFLATDHNFIIATNHNFIIDGNLPIFFETYVFNGPYDRKIKRYSTWKEAELGHEKMCKKVFNPFILIPWLIRYFLFNSKR